LANDREPVPIPLPDSAAALIANQHGVITRRQLLDVGVSDRVIPRLVRSSVLRRLNPGTFVETATWNTATDETRHLMRLLGVQLHAPDAGAYGTTGAIARRLPVRRVPTKPVVLREHAAPRLAHATVRRTQLPLPPMTMHAGLLVPSVAKTVVDVASEAPLADALITVDAALRRGVPLADLVATCELWPPLRGKRRAIDAILAGDPYSESWLESLSRGRMIERRMPLPLSNVVLRLDDRWVRTDFLLAELGVAGEADGVGKYGRRGGPLAIVVRERERHAWLEDLGLAVARWGTPEVATGGAEMQQRVDRAIGRQSGFVWPVGVTAEVPLLGSVIPPPHVVTEVARLAARGIPICFADEFGNAVSADRWAA
jgi:hypothetical protein